VNAFVKCFSALVAALAIGAASASVFANAEPGLWEISKAGSPAVKLCVPNLAVLAQYEHRNARCSRSIIRDDGAQATVHYSCAGGDFGQSDVTLVTPRSLTIRTQGISAGAPFKYTLIARRAGNCQSH
jgi:hypothetical protein